MVKVIVAGAGGRMGQTIIRLAHMDPTLKLVGAFERFDHPLVGRDVGELLGQTAIDLPIHPDLRECIDLGDVIIDFTSPASTAQNLKLAAKEGCRMVIGTTGLSAALQRDIKRLSRKIAIVQSPNMSVGVNLLFKLTELTASKLDKSYDIEIVETHHRHKRGAPGGTAHELARRAAAARNVSPNKAILDGREGETGAREEGIIGVHAVRGGDIVGDHVVSFMTDGEKIELTHRATSRDAFAKGAIQAAKFLAKKRSGSYNMQQVLGL